jgi:hypothetical protein
MFCLLVLVALPASAATIAHRYDFEGDDGADSVGTVNGAVEGDPVFTSDAKSGARSITLDGDGDFLLFSDPMDFGRQFSIALWVKPDPSAVGIQNVVGNAPGGWGTDGFKLFYNTWSDPPTADGKLILETGDGDSTNAAAVSGDPGVLIDDVWKHVVAAVDMDASSELYIDGVSYASGGVTATMKTDGPWELGRMLGGWDLAGSLDDVQIYSGALSADDAAWLASNPGAVIPEPSSIVLLLVGFLALVTRRRFVV